jgi:hypothetical protein
MLMQTVSLAGAFMILAAYLAVQQRWLTPADDRYNLLNLVGASLLLWVAIDDRSLGFIILELVWAVVAIPPLLRRSGSTGGSGPTPGDGGPTPAGGGGPA